MYSIVFGYIYLVKSRELSIVLLTISTDNIWKLCGLKLEDILIQHDFILTGKVQSNIPERKGTFTLNINRSLLIFVIIQYYEAILLLY